MSKKPDRFVIEPIFDEVNYFSEGLAAVRIGDENSGKWAFIDERAKIILPPKFDDISFGFSQGLAPVAVLQNGTKKWGYIDKNGQFKIQPQYFGAHIFYENLAPVKIGMKWGYVDRSNKVIIDPAFDEAFPFNSGYAIVKIKERYGIIRH